VRRQSSAGDEPVEEDPAEREEAHGPLVAKPRSSAPAAGAASTTASARLRFSSGLPGTRRRRDLRAQRCRGDHGTGQSAAVPRGVERAHRLRGGENFTAFPRAGISGRGGSPCSGRSEGLAEARAEEREARRGR
jgi:hypothetical protein